MWYDLVVLAILIFFTIRGAAKGMVWQLAGIAGILLCFIFADGISAAAGPYVHLDPPLNNWVILFGAYIVFTFIAYLLAGRIADFLEKVKLREFDRHLGALFGFIKGVVLCLILTFMVVTVSEDARGALLKSRSGYAAAKIVDTLHPYLPILPENLRLALEDYIHLLDHPDFDLDHTHDPGDHGTHTHDGSSSPNVVDSGNINLGNDRVLPGTPSGDASSQLWKTLSGLISDQTQKALSDAIAREESPDSQSSLIAGVSKVLESASPENRKLIEQHFQQLGNQGSEYLLSYLGQQLNVDVSPSAPPNNPAQTRAKIAELSRKISQAYTSVPAQQVAYEQQIVGFLGSLPEVVQLGVLADWNADIWSLEDPDSTTNAQSTLDQRIIRQLQVAGVSINQLEPAMQQRLRAAGAGQPGSFR
ncbi:CvpA family protein [Thalassoglobus sp. JC818]|uniref:CvpA family protein n=1 Tax=Thalassoglobus sp. JC818 TaxID=3232136 RepID=UPI00345942B8